MSTDASNEVRLAAESAASRTSRTTSSVTGPPAGEENGRRKGLSERNRPLWMLIPGGTLMLIIIVVPLILGIYMSTLNLDQYTLRRWISSPSSASRTSSKQSRHRRCFTRSG